MKVSENHLVPWLLDVYEFDSRVSARKPDSPHLHHVIEVPAEWGIEYVRGNPVLACNADEGQVDLLPIGEALKNACMNLGGFYFKVEGKPVESVTEVPQDSCCWKLKLWVTRTTDETAWFQAQGTGHPVLISVPFGWSLRPSESHGHSVWLIHTSGSQVSATGAINMARANKDGFRVVDESPASKSAGRREIVLHTTKGCGYWEPPNEPHQVNTVSVPNCWVLDPRRGGESGRLVNTKTGDWLTPGMFAGAVERGEHDFKIVKSVPSS